MNQNPINSETPTSNSTPRRWPLHLHLKAVWLVILVVVIGLALIAYFGLRNKSTTGNSPSAPAAVSVTAAGFSPAEISVKAGSQVTWTNNDAKPHEVAADPYPKNNSIPGFDNSVLLQTGDSYAFTFSKKGTYHYHDQLNPLKLLGTVVVR